VPTISSSTSDTFSATWIGIGGLTNDTTLIQCGTEQDYVGGFASYYAWYELLPHKSVTIPTVAVSPGDQIAASIQLVNETSNQWLVTLSDLNSSASFQSVFSYASSQLSADWIVERPQVDRTLSTLANFGNVTFTNCSATLGSATGVIGAFSTSQLLMYSSPVTSASIQIADVSDPSPDGSQFTVIYLSGG
jgi:hypothetical protein